MFLGGLAEHIKDCVAILNLSFRDALLTWLLLDGYSKELSEVIQARKPKDIGLNKWTHKGIQLKS